MQVVLRGSGWRNRLLPQLLLGIICATAGWLGGCSRQSAEQSAVVLGHQVAPDPPRVGPVTISLKLADAAGTRITNAQVEVEADMAHPGMAPEIFTVKELAGGKYDAQGKFDMAGDWVVLVHVGLPNGQKSDQQFDVRGVQAK